MTNPYTDPPVCDRCGELEISHYDVLTESGQRIGICRTAVYRFRPKPAVVPRLPQRPDLTHPIHHRDKMQERKES